MKLITFLLSPTLFYAQYRKEKFSEEERAQFMKKYNLGYVLGSLFLFLLLLFFWDNSKDNKYFDYLLYFMIWLYPLSRINEIFYSFINDAIDKVERSQPTSTLTFSDRIKLALTSYLELIINFSLIFYLLPIHWFDKEFGSIVDALYFSGVTITTLGYGDYSPVHSVTQILSIYEVLCGFILIVVSFSIYVGRGLSAQEKN